MTETGEQVTYLQATPEQSLVDVFWSLSPGERAATFVTTSRAAEIVGVSSRTIQLWIEFGLISAVRVGRRYRVALSSLQARVKTSFPQI